MQPARKRRRLTLALIGTLAAVTAPLSVSAPAWASSAPATPAAAAAAKPTQAQWNQLGKIERNSAVLGVADTGQVLRLSADASAATKSKIEAQLSANTATTVRTSRFTQSEVNRLREAVTGRKWNPDADKYSVAAGYDAATDKLKVLTDAPASATNSLRSAYPGAVEIEQARLEPEANRFWDAQPFWAGTALIGGVGGGNSAICTAGFGVRDRTTGHVYMTTAAHCYPNLTHVYNRRTDGSFGNWVGQVTRRQGDIDTELMATDTSNPYDSFMFTGDSLTSASSMFVHGVEWPSEGLQVCVSGSVSLNHCGHPITQEGYSISYGGGIGINNGKGFLYDQGSGRLTQGGDSGGPIYTSDQTDSAAFIVGGHSGLVYTADSECSCGVPHMIGVNVYAITSSLGVDVLTR